MKVLVTGADGFVGRMLNKRLCSAGFAIRAATLEPVEAGACYASQGEPVTASIENVAIGDISSRTDWSEVMDGVDAVVHLAARVHIMRDDATNPLAEYRRVNTQGTELLARAAADAGVKRFVYISTIKVNGDTTRGRGPFSESDEPAPTDPYAHSKWEAEQSLRRIAEESSLELVVVRPPLVYGPGVRGNFLALLGLVDRGLPLPLGGTRNARSLVYIENLCDFLARCVDHPGAAGRVFLVNDGEDLSTSELIRRLAGHLGKSVRLIDIPETPIRILAKLAGREEIVSRLFDSLVVDSKLAKEVMGWTAPVSVDDGLARTCAWFARRRREEP